MITYQDLLLCGDNEKKRMDFLIAAINDHKNSADYKFAETANKYYGGENPDIFNYEKFLYDLEGRKHTDMFSANHKIGSSFFTFALDQEVSYLLGNGIRFSKNNTLEKLGKNFEKNVMTMYTEAGIAGVCYGFWNNDHLEVFPTIQSDLYPGFAPLYDEIGGTLKAGIRFWQIDDGKPLRITLYEPDGFTEYIRSPEEETKLYAQKKAYKTTAKKARVDPEATIIEENYSVLPIFPLYYGTRRRSKLYGKKNSVAALDLLLSGMLNNVDEGCYIYWALENCGGMSDIDIKQFVERVRTLHIAQLGGTDGGAKATPHKLEPPYIATKEAIERIKKQLYEDFQAFDPAAITAGNQTATAILASYAPLDMLCDKTEYNITAFIENILAIAGIDDKPTYQRNRIINKQEEIQSLLIGANYLDGEYITKKILAIQGDADMIDEVLRKMQENEASRYKLEKDLTDNSEEDNEE